MIIKGKDRERLIHTTYKLMWKRVLDRGDSVGKDNVVKLLEIAAEGVDEYLRKNDITLSSYK